MTQHAKFLARLRGSKAGVFVFGYWMNSRGFTIEIPPTEEAPTAAQHLDYVDSGDLFAWKKTGPRLRIEVKTLGFNFTGRDDWPYREVFVSNVVSVNRSIESVYAWVSLSNDFSAAVMIKQATWETWHRTTVLVSNTGNEETNYAAPLDKVSFIPLWDAPRRPAS